jgi:4-diphosphocytidyl-2-C-methyl-D-erythritol kinase
MIVFPFCKINLGLQVLSKRTDGYHNIITCFYPVTWTDVLEILPSNSLSFTQSGISIPGKPEDNFCLKAYYLLKNDFDLPPIQIHLHKNIPAGAGLGGGSSDAAHTLRLLDTIFELKIPTDQLRKYASLIGSDCAFFIQDSPMIGKGRGELLEPVCVNLRNFFVVILTPKVHVSTAEAYSGIVPHDSSSDLRSLVEKPFSDWKDTIINDFELSIFRKYPELKSLKDSLYSLGAVYASMSGSGSSIIGIFQKEIDAKDLFRDSFGWSGWL